MKDIWIYTSALISILVPVALFHNFPLTLPTDSRYLEIPDFEIATLINGVKCSVIDKEKPNITEGMFEETFQELKANLDLPLAMRPEFCIFNETLPQQIHGQQTLKIDLPFEDEDIGPGNYSCHPLEFSGVLEYPTPTCPRGSQFADKKHVATAIRLTFGPKHRQLVSIAYLLVLMVFTIESIKGIEWLIERLTRKLRVRYLS